MVARFYSALIQEMSWSQLRLVFQAMAAMNLRGIILNVVITQKWKQIKKKYNYVHELGHDEIMLALPEGGKWSICTLEGRGSIYVPVNYHSNQMSNKTINAGIIIITIPNHTNHVIHHTIYHIIYHTICHITDFSPKPHTSLLHASYILKVAP